MKHNERWFRSAHNKQQRYNVSGGSDGEVSGAYWTASPIVKRLETEIMAIAKLPDVAGRITLLGLIPDGSSASAFRDRIARDIAKYTAVAKAAHIHFD
jgi:hypothetical protein